MKLTTYEYLCIQVANELDLDKHSWLDRLLYIEMNKDSLESKSSDIGYQTALKHLRTHQENSIIRLDATASGLQLMSLMTGDENVMKLTNLISDGFRHDIYTELYEQLDIPGIERKHFKKAVMTAFYGSEATPKRVFGPESVKFQELMTKACKRPWELNQALLNGWNKNALSHEWRLPDGFHVDIPVMNIKNKWFKWEGKPYLTQVKVNAPNKHGRSLGANVVHSFDAFVMREVIRRTWHTRSKLYEGGGHADMDTLKTLHEGWERTGFLSARVLDVMASNGIRCLNRCDPAFRDGVERLIKTLPKDRIDVVPVHDCFGVRPKDGNEIRRIYNQVMYELGISSVLEDVLEQLNIDYQFEKDLSIYPQILKAEYSLS